MDRPMDPVTPIRRKYWPAALVVSLGLNLVLLLQLRTQHAGAPAASEAATESAEPGSKRADPVQERTSLAAVPADWRWNDFSNLDLRALPSSLRATGCPEHT